jgi:ankyrin repeat protein
VRAALRNPLTNPNMVGQHGTSALVWACYYGQAAVAKELMADKRVDLNFCDHDGLTPLTWAALRGHADVMATLLADKRMDPNVANQCGHTGLMLAASQGHAAVLELLVADHRVVRARPTVGAHTYDAVLHKVKRQRNARFRGLTRAMVLFRRLRLRICRSL